MVATASGSDFAAPQCSVNPWAAYVAPASHTLRTPETSDGQHGWSNWRRGARAQDAEKWPTPSRPKPEQFTRRAKRGPMGEYLEVIDWNGLEIVPVRKDFSVEHPTTSSRSEEESEAIRVRSSIHVLRCPEGCDIPKPLPSFKEAPFPDWAHVQLSKSGFERPTPIQIQAWPSILKGFDFVGIAETGSGKTLAYLLPMLVHIMAQPELKPGEGPVGLVLVPTRELSLQISRLVQTFHGCTGLVGRELIGGEDFDEQARALTKRMDVAIATPGRLIALLNAKVTNLRRATFIVLDEADELLERGFGDQVRLVLSQVRPDRQALLFSATWPSTVETLAAEVCSQQPIHVNIGSIKLSACKSITQRFRFLKAGDSKMDMLCSALERISANFEQGHRALIFCNHKVSVDPLVSKLRAKGFLCEGFHGGQMSWEREDVLTRFQQPSCNFDILVCTQILGRGHDFRNVMFVVNFDMPSKMVEYVHRIGRTGRAGAPGTSLTLMLPGDLIMARELQHVLRESQQTIPDEITFAAKTKWMYLDAPRSQPLQVSVATRAPPAAPVPPQIPAKLPVALPNSKAVPLQSPSAHPGTKTTPLPEFDWGIEAAPEKLAAKQISSTSIASTSAPSSRINDTHVGSCDRTKEAFSMVTHLVPSRKDVEWCRNAQSPSCTSTASQSTSSRCSGSQAPADDGSAHTHHAATAVKQELESSSSDECDEYINFDSVALLPSDVRGSCWEGRGLPYGIGYRNRLAWLQECGEQGAGRPARYC